jgi:hypothetical protein
MTSSIAPAGDGLPPSSAGDVMSVTPAVTASVSVSYTAHMSTIRSDLQRLFPADKDVQPQDLTAAVTLVKRAGSLEAIETLVDVFAAASSSGRVDGSVRDTFGKELARLVKAAPAGVEPSLTRLNETQLKARLTKLEGVITQQRAEIDTLETDIAATVSRIEGRSSVATALLAQKEALQRSLKSKREQQQTYSVVWALVGVPEGSFLAVQEIDRLNREISAVDADIARTQAEKAQLQASLSTFRARQSSLRTQVDELRQLETSLVARIPPPVDLQALPPAQRFSHLAQSVQANQSLSANLARQIAVLKQMKSEAGAFDHALDALIVGLEAEAAQLEQQLTLADRAILSTLFDIVVGATGMDPHLDVGPLSVSKKVLLLDGVTGLKAALIAQAQAMFDQMVIDQLIPDTGSEALTGRLLALLKGEATPSEVADTARDVLTEQVMASLTEPQRFLVDLMLTRGPAGAPRKVLIDAIVQNAEVDDRQARAIAAAFTRGQADLTAVLVPGQTAVEAALALMRQGGAGPTLEAAKAIADVKGTFGGSYPYVHLPLRDVRDARALLTTPQVKRLGLTEVAAEPLALLAQLPSLTELCLYGRHSKDVAKALGSFTSITSLKLYLWRGLGDAAIAHLDALTSLTHLDVSYSSISGQGLGASAVGQRLVSLDLCGTDQGPGDVAALAQLPRLTHLDLSYTGVTAADVLQLAHSTSLEQVTLSGIDCDALNRQIGRQLFKAC